MLQKRPPTARSRLVTTLTEEILSNPEASAFAIASEHQLCRRFNISRVTVRLALSDLENRGLIYRRHGKGTFAHGRSTRKARTIAVLLKTPGAASHRPIAEIIGGAQSVLAPAGSPILLVNASPEEWRPEMASSLGGVIVIPQDVTPKELEVLRDRSLPFIILTESTLPGPHVILGQREAARSMTERLLELGHRRLALLTGYDACLDTPKRAGVHEALQAAGLDPEATPEFSTNGEESDILRAAEEVLKLEPRPTAIIAFDDSFGSVLIFQARQRHIRVPDELSIVGFHDLPHLRFLDPSLATVRFDFHAAGRHAAEVLHRASLTAEEIPHHSFPYTLRPGSSLASAPVDADATPFAVEASA